MLTEQFKKALPILETLEENNFKAYFVGGCVRDLLLKRSIKDVDITTSATPAEVQQLFSKVIPVGIEHGTVIVRHHKESYEVTTFRMDGDYTDNRHPDDVAFIRDIEQDLERRDFTMNALAMDKHGHIIDLFYGTQDIESKTIQTVGDGKQRFKEDALRIIRALRFSSQLGFQIETHTLADMTECRKDIEHLSIERITNEMEKFFSGDFIENGLHYLSQTEIYRNLPVLKKEASLFKKLPENMIPLASFAEVITLFHYLHPSISIQEWVKSWKCSNKIRRIAFELFEHLLYYEKNNLDAMLIYHLSNDQFKAFIRLVQLLFNQHISHDLLVSLKEKLPIQSRDDLVMNGRDLIQFFPERKQGAWIRTLLNTIEEMVVTGILENNDHEIKEWLKWNQPEVD